MEVQYAKEKQIGAIRSGKEKGDQKESRQKGNQEIKEKIASSWCVSSVYPPFAQAKAQIKVSRYVKC